MQKQKFECLEQKKFFERAIKKTGGASVPNKFSIKKSKPAAPVRIPEIKHDEEEFKPEVESDEEDDNDRMKVQAKLSQSDENPPKDPQLSTITQTFSKGVERCLPNTAAEAPYSTKEEEDEKLRLTKMEDDLDQPNPENQPVSSEGINVNKPSDQVKIELSENTEIHPAKLSDTIVSEPQEPSKKHPPKKSVSKQKKNKKLKGNRMEVDIDDVDEREDQYVGWVPPKNQSGDGRSSLNDKYGY